MCESEKKMITHVARYTTVLEKQVFKKPANKIGFSRVFIILDLVSGNKFHLKRNFYPFCALRNSCLCIELHKVDYCRTCRKLVLTRRSRVWQIFWLVPQKSNETTFLHFIITIKDIVLPTIESNCDCEVQ